MGVPVFGGLGIPATYGKVYFVNPDTGNDGNSGLDMQHPLATIAAAYDLVTTNNDDVIVLSGYSAHPVTELLAVSKNRVHFVGLGLPSRASLQGTRITMAAGISAQCLMRNTGVRNSFTNIKFVMSSAETAVKYCVEEGGEGTLYSGCAIHVNAKLDDTATSDMLLSGDSCTFTNCTFGNDNLTTSAARAVVLVDGVTGGAASMKNCYFEDCIFQIASSEANALLFKVADTAAVTFGNVLKNCVFFNIVHAGAGAVSLTIAVKSVSGLTGGTVYFVNPQTNSASFSTTSDQFEISGSPVFSSNAFEAGTPA
jgi:hypothetical protein